MFDLGVTLLHSATMFGDLADLSDAVAVLESVKEWPTSQLDDAALLAHPEPQACSRRDACSPDTR